MLLFQLQEFVLMSFALPQLVPLAVLGLTWSMVAWGAALGSIPVVIHLLHKRKYRETSWAAMRFLLEAARKHSRRLRLEQLLLLIVRTLILLFLVAGLQGLYETTTSARNVEQAPVHHILVLDASFSMQYEKNPGCTVFAQAKEAALEVFDSANRRDLFNILLLTETSERTTVKRPMRWSRQIRKVIAEEPRANDAGNSARRCRALQTTGIPPTEERGLLLPSLNDVQPMLQQDPEVPKQVYVISDFQRRTWRPESSARRDDIRKGFEDIARQADVVFIDVGVDSPQNAAVTELSTAQAYAVSGRPVRLTATVRNFGSAERTEQKLTLVVDNVERDVRRLSLEPGKTRRVEFVYPRLNPDPAPGESRWLDEHLEPGEHTFTVRLQDDALPIDNHRRLILPVHEKLKVLLVDGRPGGRERDRATFFLQKALQPSTSSQEWDGVTEPTVIHAAELQGTDLSGYACVFLCSVSTLREHEARKLQSYVDSGGAMVVCLGENVNLADYNAKLYRDGTGILPAKLVSVRGAEYGIGRFHRFETAEFDHPILEPFVGNPGSGLEHVQTWRYVRTKLPEAGGSRVALRFQRTQADRPGDPVIVESTGRGRVILITTSVDSRWSTWCINPSFPALMNEVVSFAVADRWKARRLRIGEPIQRSFPLFRSSPRTSVPVTSPDGTVQSVPLTGSDRWIVNREGADVFQDVPRDNTTPAGHIPAGTIVRRLEQRDEAIRVEWKQRRGWIRTHRVRKLTSPLLYFDRTHRNGVYDVKLTPPLGTGTERYAVNVDSRESDLHKVDEAALRRDILSGVPFQYHTRWQAETQSRRVATTHQSGLSRWFLMMVLALLLVELLMAWRFSVGLTALGGLAAFELTRLAAGHGLGAGLAAGVLLFGGVAGLAVWQWRRQRNRTTSHGTPGRL